MIIKIPHPEFPTPFDSNTWTPPPDILSPEAVTVLQTKCAPIGVLTIGRPPAPIVPKSPLVVPVVVTPPVVQTDPTSWESGDLVVGGVEVVPHIYSSSWSISSVEAGRGFRLEQGAPGAAAVLAEKLWTIVCGLLTTGNYPIAPVATAPANFGAVELESLSVSLTKAPTKYLVLNPIYWARLCTMFPFLRPGAPAFGFDACFEVSTFSGSESGVVGVAFAPSAIACVNGRPADMKSNTLPLKTTIIPQVQLEVESGSWLSLASRTLWASYTILFGCAVGDPNAAVLLKTAS